MKKKVLALLLTCTMISVVGCGEAKQTTEEKKETTATTAIAETQNTAAVAETDATEETVVETDATEETAMETEAEACMLEDGVYTATFDTDSTMFHVNEVYEGKGTLTVKNGEMTIHIVMPSQNIVNLYPGVVEDATKEDAELIEPTVEEVTYPDGLTEEVNAFDVPVPALDEEFDLALVGTKGTWYDHKVIVSEAELIEE